MTHERQDEPIEVHPEIFVSPVGEETVIVEAEIDESVEEEPSVGNQPCDDPEGVVLDDGGLVEEKDESGNLDRNVKRILLGVAFDILYLGSVFILGYFIGNYFWG